MIKLTGKCAYGGIAIGKAVFLRQTDMRAERRSVADISGELDRFFDARYRAAAELREIAAKTLSSLGDSEAQIFEIHEMMLFDGDFEELIESTIRGEKVNAEYAVAYAASELAKVFSNMDDSYMRERAADILAVSKRVCRILSGKEETEIEIDSDEGGVILCAVDLTPSETVKLDKNRILAFITAEGSVNSHTAILARTLGIPAVVGVGDDLLKLSDGAFLAVDSFLGEVYAEPDENTLSVLYKKQEKKRREGLLLEKNRGLENITLDGKKIDIFANIQSVYELGAAKENDAGGIGLFRSEFLYIGRANAPSEQEQFEAYREALSDMDGKRVVIRTLDIGADKQVPFLNLAKEENPALGMRGVRICLTNKDMFVTQLRALFRASVFGRLCIMFPMITSVREVDEILTLCNRVRCELLDEGHRISETVELGIMIETPAAAIISDKLAPLVDFFSIGTNDLSQYTMAIDRQNRSADRFFDPHHEAVLRLIETAVENAHKRGKWVGICGELGADVSMTETFLRIGVDELSVSPTAILSLRERIRGLDLGENNK